MRDAAATSRTKRYWLCQGCGTRNERRKIKCANPDCNRRRPKKRVPKHARTLRDDSYEVYREINATIHAAAFGPEWDPDCCGVCGGAPKGTRHLDRDHGHDRSELSYGKPRGLACPGDWGCNKLAARLTARKAREIADYLERVEAHYRANGLTEA